ncbi:MAG: hypothetical protein L6R38_006849 [Xanthoria sp. 2 TBL-2021]|nr:MAG: hypothetical protein L6R38_006849 [Xanthoria sp. 2 TBL-2021]
MSHCCRSVYVEVQESLKKPNEGLDVELSWQGVRINPLSVFGMRYRSGGNKWHMNAMPYLCVKIFAPHPKHPTDIICLWYYAKALGDQLRGYLRIPRLVIDFEESTDFTEDLPYHSAPPSWSKAGVKGLPKRSIEHEETDYGNCDAFPQCFCRNNTYEKDDREATCDVKYILDVFSLATTASAVEINLPPSLSTQDKLRTIAQQRIDVMMNRNNPLFDYNAYVHGMAWLLKCSSKALIHQTGQNSFRELVRLTQGTPQMKDARSVQEFWPHIYCLTRSRDQTSRLHWPSHWLKGLTSLTPSYGCKNSAYGVKRSRHFKYEIRSPPETIGGRYRRPNRSAGYWQLKSLFASDGLVLHPRDSQV